jgi:hypothetical protein
MQNETINEIEEITKSLARLLVDIEPKTGAEWDAMERLQAAHKQMRSIEIAELVEQAPRAGFTK